eukprot:3275585-Pyramimonas_sp.AAC.1
MPHPPTNPSPSIGIRRIHHGSRVALLMSMHATDSEPAPLQGLDAHGVGAGGALHDHAGESPARAFRSRVVRSRNENVTNPPKARPSNGEPRPPAPRAKRVTNVPT